MPPICDYEGSRYRADFWEGQHREYEDRVERAAMQKLLPPRGERLIEVGAGFGRLVDLYQGYDQVILIDYARTQLEEAQKYLGDDKRFIYVAADVYKLPFVNNLFDALTMVRVMHHVADVPAALAELQRILKPGGVAVVEYASKFHLKSLMRWLFRRQPWSPFDQTPLEFVELNFNFHPAWMRQQFEIAGLQIKNVRTLSHYRLNILKRMLPISWLVRLDRLAQPTGNWWQLTPSVFLQAQARKPNDEPAPGFFRCPVCRTANLSPNQPFSPQSEGMLTCLHCQRGWLYRAGIYDFKTPIRTEN